MCRKCVVVGRLDQIQFEKDRKRYKAAKEEMCEPCSLRWQRVQGASTCKPHRKIKGWRPRQPLHDA
jgi:hypothetical protein